MKFLAIIKYFAFYTCTNSTQFVTCKVILAEDDTSRLHYKREPCFIFMIAFALNC